MAVSPRSRVGIPAWARMFVLVVGNVKCPMTEDDSFIKKISLPKAGPGTVVTFFLFSPPHPSHITAQSLFFSKTELLNRDVAQGSKRNYVFLITSELSRK